MRTGRLMLAGCMLVISMVMLLPQALRAAADAVLGVDSTTGVMQTLTPAEASTLLGVSGLDSNFDIQPTINGAVPAKPFRFGDGVSGQTDICGFTDQTLGSGVLKPCVDTHTRSYIWTNFNWELFDVEGNTPMIVADPDAFATGSGTVTMQTSEQFVGSNLGIEFSESDTNPACASGNYTIYADTSEATLKYCNNGVTYTPAQEIIIRKTSNETINNSATLQNDDVLVFAASANTTYSIKLFVLYDASQASDFQYAFTLPTSASGYKVTTNTTTTTTTCSGSSGSMVYNDITITNNNVGAAGVGATCALMIDGTVITAGTAGNVQFRWAQATADATNATVQANSWMSYRRLP